MQWVATNYAALFLLLFIPLNWTQAGERAAKKVFTFRLQAEPATLDWNRAHTPLETYLLVNLMEGLLQLDSNLKPVPGLAKSFTVSADRKVYTFHLRPGVKWSDGALLKAEDFVYSWKRLLAPETGASYAYFLYDIEGAKDFNQGKIKNSNHVGISAIDPLTLQVKLIQPVSYWPFITTFWVTFPLRQDVVEKPGTRWETSQKLVTLGPYLLDHHEFNSKFVLKSNPNYYGKKGNVDEVVGQIVTDDAAALSLYEAGSLDFLSDISTMDLKRLERRADLKVFPYLKTVYLGFVLDKKSVADVHVRRAIAKSIDKAQFSQILRGGQAAASSFLPNALSKSFALGTQGLVYNPHLAKVEFDQAKLKPAQLSLTLPSFDKSLLVGQILQSSFQKYLGIELELQSWDSKAYQSRLTQKSNPVFLASWSADYPDPDNFFSVFLGDSGNNRTSWKNAAYDQLVVRASHVPQLSERKKLYQKMEKILLQNDTVIIPLYYEPNVALIKPRVKKLELNPLNYLNLKNVRLD
jgi:oligopeptide transport system substrate-binding protein